MPSKRYNAEAIIHKLREADVLLGQEFRAGSMHPLGLGGITAIPITVAELFELVVQISQGVISIW